MSVTIHNTANKRRGPRSDHLYLSYNKITVFPLVITATAEQGYLSQARHSFVSNERLLQSYIASLLLSRQTPCSLYSALPEISPPLNNVYVMSSAKRKEHFQAFRHHFRKSSASLQPSKSRTLSWKSAAKFSMMRTVEVLRTFSKACGDGVSTVRLYEQCASILS